jgi:hypothetical protein
LGKIALIHAIIKKHVHEDPVLEALAKHQGLGYFNVNDQRTSTNYGRVSDPEDILGTVRLNDGKMVPGTYEKYVLFLMQNDVVEILC